MTNYSLRCKHPHPYLSVILLLTDNKNMFVFPQLHAISNYAISLSLPSLQLILLKRKLFPRRRVNRDSNPERVWKEGRLPSPLLSALQHPPPCLSCSAERSQTGGLGENRNLKSSVLVLHQQHGPRLKTRCEMVMKHFSEDDGWGWPVKGMAARKKKPVVLLFLRWGHLRRLYNTHTLTETQTNTP